MSQQIGQVKMHSKRKQITATGIAKASRPIGVFLLLIHPTMAAYGSDRVVITVNQNNHLPIVGWSNTEPACTMSKRSVKSLPLRTYHGRRPLVIEPNGSAAADATKKRTGAMRIIVAHGGRLWCAKRTNLLMGAFMKYCRADAS